MLEVSFSNTICCLLNLNIFPLTLIMHKQIRGGPVGPKISFFALEIKQKKFFFYPVWDEKGIRHISDLFLGHNVVKTFEDPIIEYDTPIRDRRKYNF